MNAHSDDFDMADDLRDLSQVYRNAVKHEDGQEPSPALDAAILAMAHRAVASRPQAVQSLRFARWRVPLAMAASFLVCISIVMQFIPKETGPEALVLAQMPQALPVSERLQPSQIPPQAEAEPDTMQASKPFARAADKPVRARTTARLSESESSKAVAMEEAKETSDMPVMREMSAKRQNPQAWLEKIEKLRRDGKIEEARESLAEFRKQYPDHELPKALRDL
jgi:hypothetical protein